jgi:hypothetical protein
MEAAQMNRTGSPLLILVFYIALSAIGLLLWIGGVFVLWLVLGYFGWSYDFWIMLESLSTAIATTALLGAGLFAVTELSEAANTRHLDVVDRLLMELNSEENIEARRWLFTKMPNGDPGEVLEKLDDTGRKAIKRTLNSFDRVSFLTQPGWVPEKTVMPWLNPMIVKAWFKLAPFVEYERERRNEPDYYQRAEALAKKCIDWRVKNVQSDDPVWLEDAL